MNIGYLFKFGFMIIIGVKGLREEFFCFCFQGQGACWGNLIKKLGISISLGGRDIDPSLREEGYG